VEATERPWRQILHLDLIGSPFGIATFLLIYYAAASLFTIYYPVIFKNPNGTNFSVTQANGLNTWFWGADIVALIVVGLLSDALRVRKPFMLVGAALSMVMLVLFLGNATHPHTSYYTLAFETSLLALGVSLVFAPWMAGYTESVEDKNPGAGGHRPGPVGLDPPAHRWDVIHLPAPGDHQREPHRRQPAGGRARGRTGNPSRTSWRSSPR
jgi:ACS family D-galactonate transporter-like MFS transporter